MKTVTGQVKSSKSVSLSKVARILSKFASSDNEASPAFSSYLKRATASFNELAQFHKELKSSGSERQVKKRHSDGAVSERTIETVINHAAVKVVEVKNESESLNGSKGMKKMSRQDGFRREATQVVENADDVQRKHKKNKKKHGINEQSISSGIKGDEQRKEQVGLENVDRGGEQKKHETNQTRERKEKGDKGKPEIEAANKESRKRKHENVAARVVDGSQEKHKSKKKKSR